MNGFRNFLESSTIHGLTYISSSRKFVRLFWTAVIVAGFTCASILIHTSFQDWSENPIKTTIETLPIKDIKFPKLTVCPPKNTVTNLNYDLMMTRNMTLDDEERKDLVNYATMVADSQNYDQIIRNLSMFHEENRYYNWYHGYTKVELPRYVEHKSTNELSLTTTAASGSISLQNLEQVFDAKTGSIEMEVNLFLPKKNASKSDNIQLHLEIDRNKMMDGNESFAILKSWKYLYSQESHIIRNITQQYPAYTPNEDGYYSTNFVYKMYLNNGVNGPDNTPGMKVKWYYTGESLVSEGIGWYLSDSNKQTLEMNKAFRKFVNLFLKHPNAKNFWDKVIETSVNSTATSWLRCDSSSGLLAGLNSQSNVNSLVRIIEGFPMAYHNNEFFKHMEELSKTSLTNITEEIFNTAGEMFVFFNHCPRGGNKKWIQFYKDLSESHEPDVILMTLNRLMKTSQRDTAKKILDYLDTHWNLKFRNSMLRSAEVKYQFQNDNSLR